MKTSLDDVMRRFAQFLSASWGAASAVATTMKQVESAEFMSDWAQANWELLVETPFREIVGFGKAYLEPYGEGADCNDASSRFSRPSALPTHRIVCRPGDDASMLDLLTGRSVGGAGIPLVFDHFAIKSEYGWHEEAPPFDCVLGYEGEQEVLVRIDQIFFVAEEVGSPGP
jgi:hypothetical protein